MKELDERYYKGFEGDPEMLFSLENQLGEIYKVGIWEGFFNRIVKKTKPKNGYWTGLAYYYHLNIGWYEESPWQVPNPKEAYEQLAEIDMESLEYPEEKEILTIILNMFKEAIENDYKIYIAYE